MSAKISYGKNNSMALLHASENGYDMIVIELLKDPTINVNIQDNNNKNTPLLLASNQGHFNIVVELLKHPDIDINLQNNNKNTPLTLATDQNHLDIVIELLKRKEILVNLQNTYDQNALTFSSYDNNYKIVIELLKHKNIDINLQDEDGRTSLIMAVEQGNYKIVKKLLNRREIDVNIQSKFLNSALIISSAKNKYKIVVELLKHKNIDINLKNNHNDTALMIASSRGYDKIEKELLKYERKIRTLEREKITKQIKAEPQRAKKQIQKQKERTKNKSCSNVKDYMTLEDMENIPSSDLIYIKLKSEIYCYEKDSFKNMIKYSNKVRGNCRPPIPNQPLNCDFFYPITLDVSAYITEQNYNQVKKNINNQKWILKNKDDMEILSNLKTYSYDYIDTKFQSKPSRKGMIAQEVEEVYPNAISKCTDYVPNIYKIGYMSTSNDKVINVDFEESEDIKVGSFVKLMIYSLETDKGEVAEFEIENIGDNQLTLKESIDLDKYHDELFVVGTKVKDFRNISNDDMLFISIGAIKHLKQENDGLKSQLVDILSRLEALERPPTQIV